MSSSQERQPRRQKKQQQVVEESESDSGSEEQQYEPPKRSNRRSRQQNNQMQQRQQQGPMNQMGGGMPGTMGNVANQAMQQQQPQGGGGGGKSDTLRLRLDLNLDIEITLKAKIHGDLELALLYVLTLFIFCLYLPLYCFLPPGCVVPCMGEGLQTYLQVDGEAPCLLVSLLCFWSYSHRENRNIHSTVQPNRLSSYHHHTVTTSVLYLKNGQGHNVKKFEGAPWTAAKRRENTVRHKQHTPRLSNTRQCVFVWRTGTKTRSQKKSCNNTVVFPWLASLCFGCAVLSRAISALFPTPSCTVAANKEMRGDMVLMLGTRN